MISNRSKKMAKGNRATEAMECRGPKWQRWEEDRQVEGIVALLQS